MAAFWHGLASNHRADEAHLLPTLGYGNRLTIARGLMLALLAGLPAAAARVAGVAARHFHHRRRARSPDGYVARITNHSTKLGEMLDMEYDVIGIFAAVLLAISYGQLPGTASAWRDRFFWPGDCCWCRAANRSTPAAQQRPASHRRPADGLPERGAVAGAGAACDHGGAVLFGLAHGRQLRLRRR
ncbi:MAG: CDP-alcohol phosphatidyltransferase family protein [Caldilineaceae bacterium]